MVAQQEEDRLRLPHRHPSARLRAGPHPARLVILALARHQDVVEQHIAGVGAQRDVPAGRQRRGSVCPCPQAGSIPPQVELPRLRVIGYLVAVRLPGGGEASQSLSLGALMAVCLRHSLNFLV